MFYVMIQGNCFGVLLVIVHKAPVTLTSASAKTYRVSGTPLLRQDTRNSHFAPLTLGAPRCHKR